MKIKLGLLFCFCLMFAWGCKDDDEVDNQKLVLDVKQEQLTFARAEKELKLELNTNQAWKITDESEWIHVTPASGAPGDVVLTVKVDENTLDEERSGFFKITVNGQSKEIKVVQSERSVVIADNVFYEVDSRDTLLSVSVRTNTSFDVDIIQDSVWIVQKVQGKALETRNLEFKITENKAFSNREAKVILTETNSDKQDTIRIVQRGIELLDVEREFRLAYNKSELVVPVTTNLDLEVDIPSEVDWLTLKEIKKANSVDVVLSVKANESGNSRKGTIVLRGKNSALEVSVNIIQSCHLKDGDVFVWQKATKGKGIDLIFMGDGYNQEDIDNRKYEDILELGVKYFFDVEPFASYREYFNVYMVVAVSNESGMTHTKKFPPFKDETFDTKFKAQDDGRGMTINFGKVGEYADKARKSSVVKEHVAVVVANFDYYMGSAYMGFGLESGRSTCVFTASYKGESPNSFKELMQHEAGGHAFGCLADEYRLSPSLPQDEYDYVLRVQKEYGWYENVAVINDPKKSPWAQFIGHEKYPEVGWFEGGDTYHLGVWRPTETSIMADMIGEFNAPSRAAIVKRIKQLAGEEYSFEDFVANDKLAGKWPMVNVKSISVPYKVESLPVRVMPD